MDSPDLADRIAALVRAGELLAAVDLARSPAARRLPPGRRRRAAVEEVTALARMGSLGEALEAFAVHGLGEAAGVERSLRARLWKDLGFEAEGAERAERLRAARDLYLAEAREAAPGGPRPDRTHFEWNAVNAVSLSRLIGDMGPAADCAAALAAGPPGEGYWSLASRAEFLIATGGPGAEAAAARAAAAADATVGNRATTIRQLSRLAPGHPAIDRLRPGPAVHVSGHMIAPRGAAAGRVLWRHRDELAARIGAALATLAPSSLHGSLAAGGDTIAAEWALTRGIETFIHLPFAVDAFMETSVRPSGEGWVRRARACLRHPRARLRLLSREGPVAGDDLAYAEVARVAMGAAILEAERDGAEAVQLLVWDGRPPAGPAGTAADGAVWAATGRPRRLVDVADLGAPEPERRPARPQARLPRALVFGDVKNFSKLGEAQLPAFVRVVMGAARAAVDAAAARYGPAAFLNTWGDGVFAAFPTASGAAEFALGLQERMAALDLPAEGLPADLAIRLGLHAGLVWPLTEPVTGAANLFGEAVARAARIETVTKAGRIFATEEFASLLALDPAGPARTEYVGAVETAKRYGAFRLHRLIRR